MHRWWKLANTGPAAKAARSLAVAQIALAGAKAEASARLGREVLVGADPLPRLLELIEKAKQQGNMAGYGLGVWQSRLACFKLNLPKRPRLSSARRSNR